MRIGIDCRMMGKLQATGIGNYIEQLVTRIIALDTEDEFVLFFKPENAGLLPDLPKHVKKVISACHWYSLCEQLTFCRQLYRENLDLVHFPQFNVPILYRRPFVVTIHDITAYLFPGPKMSSRLRQRAFRLVFDTALKNSRKIFVVSEYTKSRITEVFAALAEKIIVTKLGVENAFLIDRNYGKIEGIKSRFSITKPYIFYVGVWRPHKNVVGLLKAFEILKTKHHLDIQLVLGGKEDPNYPEVRKTWESFPAEISGSIIKPGFISEAELPYFYQGAAAYVVPSFEEGFGLNGLEAMASGTPVISSNRASLPEIYGKAAAYFNPADSEEMADKIAAILNNETLRIALIEKGKVQITAYSWDIAAKETLDTYRKTL